MILIFPTGYDSMLLAMADIGIRYLDTNNRFETMKYRWNWNQSKAGNLQELERHIIDWQYLHGAMLTIAIVDSNNHLPFYIHDTADIVLFHRTDNKYVMLKNDFTPFPDGVTYSTQTIESLINFYKWGK